MTIVKSWGKQEGKIYGGCEGEEGGLYHIPRGQRPKSELENGNRVGVKKAILESKKGLQTYPVLVA